jgi:SulP family sulfate permease
LHYLETILGSHSKLPELVEAMEYIYLKAGNSLIQRDDDGSSIFILVQGRLKVQIDLPDGRQLRLRTMTSGAVVGEISFYLHKKRTADVIVEEDSIVLRLDAQVLVHLEKENSEVAILIHRLLAINLSEKLKHSNRLIEIANNLI